MTRTFGASAIVAILTTSCSPAPGADVRAGEIIEQPGAHVGQSLTVSGKIEDVHGPRAFTIDSGVQDGDLLVLSAEPLPQLADITAPSGRPKDDYTGIVTGVVRLFVAADIEREVGWDIEPALEEEYTHKAVIISRTTRLVAEDRQ